jgi:xanthine/uracil permease
MDFLVAPPLRGSLTRARRQRAGDKNSEEAPIALLQWREVVDNRVDFSVNANLIVGAVTLVLGTGDYTLKFGAFALGGIGTATFGAIAMRTLLRRRR